MSSLDMEQALPTFLAESRELLEEMEAALLNVTESPEPSELINAIFRAAHTIKGSAGLFGLDGVVSFTHVLESLLDRVREGELALDEALVGLLLESRDHMTLQIDAIGRGEAASEAAGKASFRGRFDWTDKGVTSRNTRLPVTLLWMSELLVLAKLFCSMLIIIRPGTRKLS